MKPTKLLISDIIANGEYYTALSTADNNQYHCHEFIEIFYVVAGNAVHELNGKKQTVGVCYGPQKLDRKITKLLASEFGTVPDSFRLE